jgi:hypothetical protein
MSIKARQSVGGEHREANFKGQEGRIKRGAKKAKRGKEGKRGRID